MKRSEILLHAGRELHDQSPNYLADVLDPAFDLILADLARAGAISALTSSLTASPLTESVRAYSTRTLSGLAAPYFPLEILSLRVWAWGLVGILEKVSDAVFAFRRSRDGDTSGQPSCWRYYPNEQAIELHKIPNSAAASASLEVTYLKPPTLIAQDTDITEVHYEDIPVIVLGLKSHGAEDRNDDVADRDSMRQKALVEWQAGMGQMVQRARRLRLTDRQKQAQDRTP